MPNFTRTIENFVCEHCGAKVRGNGYTNHCPRCLWSKHVDIHPGDRENDCRGMLEPIGVELDHGEHVIIHRCQKCGVTKRNKAAPEDDFDDILKLSPKLP